MNCRNDSSTPKQSLVQIRRMWQRGRLREWETERVSASWIPYARGPLGCLVKPENSVDLAVSGGSCRDSYAAVLKARGKRYTPSHYG